MKRPFIRSQVWTALGVASVLGCGGGESPSNQAPTNGPRTVASDYSIKVVVNGRVRRFGPREVDERSGGGSLAQSVRVPGDAESLVESNALDATLLVAAAAGECGAYNEYTAGSFTYGEKNPYEYAKWATSDIWGDGAWYVFAGGRNFETGENSFRSCDDVLFNEEVLLCTASKLEEIATTLKPLVWDKANIRPLTFPDELKAPIVIPPQLEKDRFIVRDLALNVLAHLGRLDQETPQEGGDQAQSLLLSMRVAA